MQAAMQAGIKSPDEAQARARWISDPSKEDYRKRVAYALELPLIVAAAIKIGDKVYTGKSHYDVECKIKEPIKTGIEGFVDEDQGFHTRQQALRLALANGQLKSAADIKMKGSGKLCSEDIKLRAF